MTKDCEFCGGEITVLRSRLERQGSRFRTFDRLCDWIAKGGRADPTAYGENWIPVKRKALDRDDHRSQNCRKTAAKLGQEPDVHHITPIKEFDEPADA